MAEKCQICQRRDKCNKKRMEACAYFEESFSANAVMPSVSGLAQPMVVKHDYRDIKVAENMTITIDVEDLKKQMKKDFYKVLECGFNYGAR